MAGHPLTCNDRRYKYFAVKDIDKEDSLPEIDVEHRHEVISTSAIAITRRLQSKVAMIRRMANHNLTPHTLSGIHQDVR